MDDLNPKMINFPINYSEYWSRHAYAFDMEKESELLTSPVNLKQLIGLSWLISLRNQVAKTKLSLIITVEGRHRSGKSVFSAVDLAMIFDATYKDSMKSRIVSDANQLLELIKTLQTEKIQNPVIIVDEAGASLASTDWYEKIQKAVLKTMQIIGFLHPIIVFIAPVQNQIASGLRQMSHVYIKVVRTSNKYSTLYPANVKYESRWRKFYYPRPRVKIMGTNYTISGIKITMPPKELSDMYEAIEAERKPLMLDGIKEDAQVANIKKVKQNFDYDKTAVFCASNLERYETRRSHKYISDPNREIKIDAEMIQHDFKCTQSQARIVKRLAEEAIEKKKNEVQQAIINEIL